jgi:hypothetical protein
MQINDKIDFKKIESNTLRVTLKLNNLKEISNKCLDIGSVIL